MAVDIHRHHDRRMTKSLLNHLARQFEAAIVPPVNAPRRIEVAEGVQASVLAALDRPALSIFLLDGDAGR